MLTEQEPAAPTLASAQPAQQHFPQPAAGPSAAPQPAVQSNVFAAALAQAMGMLHQQQGLHAAVTAHHHWHCTVCLSGCICIGVNV